MTVRVTGEALAPFLKLLDDFRVYSREGDAKSIVGRFVADDDIVSFGGLANKFNKSEYRQHVTDFFQHNKGEIPEYKKVVVYQYGEAACLCAVVDRQRFNKPNGRVTLFLENHEGQWLIRHRHHSNSPD